MNTNRRNLIRALVQHRIGSSPRQRKRKWRRADRAIRASCGVCCDCNAEALPDESRCAGCKAYQLEWSKGWYEERVKLGLCQCRQRPVVTGQTLCATCAERNRLGAKARRAAAREAR